MQIPFIKMQAQGNDFVILNLLGHQEADFDAARLAKDICDRRFGVGADGLVLLLDSEIAAAKMQIFNSDGSRALMCGSALRCISRLLKELSGITEAEIATDAGIRPILIENNTVQVSLGKPFIVSPMIVVEGINGCLVNVGNHHFVCFDLPLEDDPHLHYGPVFERHPDLPSAVNTHFVRVISSEEIEIKIWERGVGATFACGTGAAACVLCGMEKGILKKRVTVNMPGGAVSIQYLESGECVLGGEVSETFSGAYQWKI
ncbi:MAG: diaminopimelate epimerase [Candidatus Cloacimonadaceae bacterium]|nr:diaminopimelate epimerase [Candidatus Cloacimonadaceae bacterium]MDP3113871.1 diaminopimelate epimerase [Candidatus Cloacimonadaceae bacterium]